MKTLTTNDVAWVATVTTIQDGDPGTEANMDVVNQSIANRLGHLKGRVDEKVVLAGNNAITGDNTHAGDETFNGPVVANDIVTFNDDLVTAGRVVLAGPSVRIGSDDIRFDSQETLADAAATITKTLATVPTITADRLYTLPTAIAGRVCLWRRPGGAAFRAGVERPSDSTLLAQLASATRGWVLFAVVGGDWKVFLHSEIAGFVVLSNVV